MGPEDSARICMVRKLSSSSAPNSYLICFFPDVFYFVLYFVLIGSPYCFFRFLFNPEINCIITTELLICSFSHLL